MRKPRPVSMVAVVLAVIVLGSCDAVAPTYPPGPGETPPDPTPAVSLPQPTATAPVASAAPPVASAAPPVASAAPPVASTPEPLMLGGTWARPRAGATLDSYTTMLSAKPTATGDGETTFTKVVFFAKWAGAPRKVACKATRPGASDLWSCKPNLLGLGVPPGKVTFTFDVHGVGVPVARSPDGPHKVTYAVKPPRPTNTRLQQIEQPDMVRGDNHPLLHRVRWSAPAGYADEFLLYQTFECPRPSTRQNSGKPCFIAGTPVDTSQLTLLAKVAGDERSVRLRLWESECGPSHGTILLRARNAYGQSVFAIVQAAPVLWVPPGDMIC